MNLKDWTLKFHDAGGEGADFRPSDRDEPDVGDNYYGFVSLPDRDGNVRWIILQETVVDDVTETRYTKVGKGEYPANWVLRATLDYFYYYEL